jgi:hypothetical protein
MNKRVLAIIVVAIVAIAAIAIPAARIFASEEYIIIDFDPGMARLHVQRLIENGPRPAASENELKGSEYVVSQFKEAGLTNCHVETFSAPAYKVHTASLQIVRYGPLGLYPNPRLSPIPYTHKTDFVLQGFSGTLIWESFRDDLDMVFIGNGTKAEDYANASGAVAVIDYLPESPGNDAVYTYGAKANVSAIAMINMRMGEDIGYPPMCKGNWAWQSWEGEPPEIPFFMVSKAVGEQFRQYDDEGKLRMDFNVEKGMMDTSVAVGEIRGSTNPEKLYIIGGHQDTCYNTVGVVDNTVGAALIIEMAYQMAKYQPSATIRFCTWGNEENGLFGSNGYVAAHEEEIINNLVMHSNFDMSHTDIERVNGYTVATSINASIPKMEAIRDIMVERTPELQKYKISIGYNDGGAGNSDHWAFSKHGLDVTNCWGGGSWDYEYHTYQDDMDRLNEESLQIGARIIGSYIISETC